MKHSRSNRGHKKKTALLTVIATLVLSLAAVAQEPAKPETPETSKRRPSVYLTHKFRGETRLKNDAENSSKRIELHNNSKFQIAVVARRDMAQEQNRTITRLPSGSFGRIANDGELLLDVCYEAELVRSQYSISESFIGSPDGPKLERGKEPAKVPSGRSCRFSELCIYVPPEIVWIKPGSSIQFDVPAEALANGLRMFTVFIYEWEYDFGSGDVVPNEPIHRIYIDSAP